MNKADYKMVERINNVMYEVGCSRSEAIAIIQASDFSYAMDVLCDSVQNIEMTLGDVVTEIRNVSDSIDHK